MSNFLLLGEKGKNLCLLTYVSMVGNTINTCLSLLVDKKSVL